MHESTAHESSSVHNSSMVSLPAANTLTKDCLNGQDKKSEQMIKASVVLHRLDLTKSRMKRKSCLEFQTDASSETKPVEDTRIDHIRC